MTDPTIIAGQEVFGLSNAVVPGLEILVYAVDGLEVQEQSHEGADGNGKIVEPADARALPIYPIPDVRKGSEHEICDTEQVRHVDGDAEDDRLRGEHTDRAKDGVSDLDWEALELLVGVQLVIACLLDEPLALPLQQRGWVGLRELEKAGGLDGNGGNAG